MFVSTISTPAVQNAAVQSTNTNQSAAPEGVSSSTPVAPAITQTSTTTRTPRPTRPPLTTLPSFSHVFVVVEENHNYADVIGSSAMPFLNGLATQYGLATAYYANTHPSIGNYFALTTGQILTNDDAFNSTLVVDNIAQRLTAAGKTWKAYEEDLPSVGYTGGDTANYVKHHNPFVYFSSVNGSSSQLNNVVPFTQFSTDITNNQLPNFGFIVPNLQHDAHDGTLAAADQWLQTNITPLLNSTAFQQSGLLIIVFDESENDNTNGGGKIAMVMVSSKSKSGFQSATLYQHQDTLRTILQTLGVSSDPCSASSGPSMAEFFQ